MDGWKVCKLFHPLTFQSSACVQMLAYQSRSLIISHWMKYLILSRVSRVISTKRRSMPGPASNWVPSDKVRKTSAGSSLDSVSLGSVNLI